MVVFTPTNNNSRTSYHAPLTRVRARAVPPVVAARGRLRRAVARINPPSCLRRSRVRIVEVACPWCTPTVEYLMVHHYRLFHRRHHNLSTSTIIRVENMCILYHHRRHHCHHLEACTLLHHLPLKSSTKPRLGQTEVEHTSLISSTNDTNGKNGRLPPAVSTARRYLVYPSLFQAVLPSRSWRDKTMTGTRDQSCLTKDQTISSYRRTGKSSFLLMITLSLRYWIQSQVTLYRCANADIHRSENTCSWSLQGLTSFFQITTAAHRTTM